MVNKILFITLSNIGDVILTLPVLDSLKENFPEAHITVMVGPRPKEIFENNPHINRIVVYDKHSKLKEKIKLFNELKKEKFDIVVDLRNSLFGALLPARYKTSSFMIVPKDIKHMKDRHIYKIQNFPNEANQRGITSGSRINAKKVTTFGTKFKIQISNIKDVRKVSLYIKPEDEKYIKDILKENGINKDDKIVVISPGARSHIKRWDKESFLKICKWLIEKNRIKIILVGDKQDLAITQYIAKNIKEGLLDLCAKTSIPQLAALLKKAELLVTNDSAVLHLGSYLNIPILAIFGPTDETKYGPWSERSSVVTKNIFCRPCERAQCRYGTLECMRLIKPEDVIREIKNISVTSQQNNFKRILIVRTDRIGDVLLSSPVIKVLRVNYPSAYIAMMVSPYAKDIIDANPYLDEVIVYDKNARHRSWFSSIGFALNLKQKRFDLAIILHPTNRVHLVTFFAGIPQRVGYDRKLGFLLTDRIRHTKQLGEKHEIEYSLDLVRYLGIEPQDKSLFMPIKGNSEIRVEDLLESLDIKDSDKLLAIHPGASCPSKIWPAERFADACDRLIEKYGFKVLIIAGPKDMKLAQIVSKNMHHTAHNLAGKTSVSQLASLLKRCHLFISNDSGPVHIASAVGTPVISIFGRNQRGLSPLRWGPVGKRDKILHKEVGCIECLAHNCVKDFACLKAITVDDVLNAVDSILKS